jgi:hypothetical protein
MPAWLKRIVPELSEGPAGEFAPTPGHAAPVPALATSGAVGETLPGAASSPATVALPMTRMVTDAPRVQSMGVLRPVGASVGADRIVLPHARPFRIGRADENELQLFDPRVSNFHAEITFDRGAFFVRDLGSTNGTFVNGERVTAPRVLRRGDQLEIGNMDSVVFTYELEAVPVPRAGTLAAAV